MDFSLRLLMFVVLEPLIIFYFLELQCCNQKVQGPNDGISGIFCVNILFAEWFLFIFSPNLLYQTLRQRIQDEYREVVERRVITGSHLSV